MSRVEIRGKLYKRIPCGENDYFPYNQDRKQCKDCGVNIGEYHIEYCEAEMCPAREDCHIYKDTHYCLGQLCGCQFNQRYLEE